MCGISSRVFVNTHDLQVIWMTKSPYGLEGLFPQQMLKQEIVNLVEKVHPALAVAVFVAAVNAVVLVGINHQVELLTVRNHGLDELHSVLVVDVVIAAAVAKQVVTFNHRRIVDG